MSAGRRWYRLPALSQPAGPGSTDPASSYSSHVAKNSRSKVRCASERNTAFKELDAFRRAYGVTDKEWREMLASYGEQRHKERQRPLAERMTEPVTLLRLKWPSRLRLPPPGAPLKDYQAYIERMRPGADAAGGIVASALNILQEMVERELGRQQRQRGKFQYGQPARSFDPV